MNLISAAEAKAAGLKQYFTGEPCKHGHISARKVSSRSCLECERGWKLEKKSKQVPRPATAEMIVFDGSPCRRGHTSGRYSSNGKCVDCHRAWKPKDWQKEYARQKAWRLRTGTVYRRKSGNSEWRKRNPSKVAEYNARSREKRRSTPRGKLDDAMSLGIRTALGGSKRRVTWQRLVGYTVDELMRHLEKQFLKGMTWENRGEWHIDHIVPRSSFKYSSPDDEAFKQCWALSNLRPLWSVDNMRKGAKSHFLV